jgi:hypothetical protein
MFFFEDDNIHKHGNATIIITKRNLFVPLCIAVFMNIIVVEKEHNLSTI